MTKFSLVSLFLFSALLSSAFSVPFNLLNEESTNGIGFTRETTCAKSCNLAPDSEQLIKFKVGNTYSYNVDLITEIDEQELERSLRDTKEHQQVKIGAVADISVYGPCEFVLRLRKVHLTGIANHRQLAEQLETESLHFSYENGRIVDVCASGEDKPWTINVKKSILSALQMSAKDVTQKDTIIETDISGQCDTVYEPIETNRDQTNFIIRKVKQLNKCGQRHQSNIGFFPRSYPGLEQVIRSAMPLVDAAYECTQKIERNIVTRTECTDRQRLWPSTVEVRSMIELNLIEQHENEQTTKSMPKNFQRHRLAMSNVFFGSNNEFDQKQLAHHRHHHTHNYQNQQIRSIGYEQSRYSVEDVRQIVQLICPKVVDSVEIDVAQLFSQLVEAKHGLKSEDELKLFKQIQSRELCQSPKMVDLYLDASALTGTVGSVDVLIYAYQHGLVTGSRASYLFSLLSFVKHPSVEGAQKLVQFLKEHYNTEFQYQQPQQKQLPRGVVLGISGYVHNLEQSQSHDQSLNEFVQQVVELFVQNLEHCTVQLEQQRSINAGPITVGQCLTYVNALRNVGLSRSSSAVVDRLVKIVEQNPSAGDSNLNVEEVRIAVIRALLTGANDQIRHFLFEKIVKNTAESPELQIEAYKTIVMSGTSRTQLQEIKSYLEQIEATQNGRQLVNYVRSHQDNLRTTTDPHRQAVLPVDAPIFPKPSPQKYGFSRNYEFSYVHEGLNVGFTAEADLVFPSHHQQSRSLPVPVPHEFVFNLTVPVLGKEFQVVEVRVHQHGMEQVIARQLRDMERNTKEDLFTIARQMISTIVTDGADILSENPNIQLVLEISVDGKTLVVADQHDLVTDESDRNDILREIMDTLQKRVSIDRAFGFKPIDTVVQVPTLNGLPVQFRLNSSVVFGLKTELNFDARDLSNSVIEFEMFPSVSAQWESAVEFFTGSEHKSVESVSRLYAAPQLNWKLEAKEGRMLGVKIDLPKDRYTVARFESQLYTRNENGERIRINQRQRAVRDITNHYNYEQCSDLTKKPFGVAFCYDVEYANNGHNSADLITEFYMVKVDRQLRSYELYAEMPFSVEQLFNARRGMTYRDLMRQEKASIKFAFNTPGSEIDREISVEIDLPTEGTANSEIEKSGRIRIQTPWKQIEAKALVRNQMKEKTIQAEVIVDQKQFFQAEIALEALHRGQKTEYKPRLILKMASRINPIHMTGVVSYTQGPKTKLYIELEDAHKQITYIKCTVVKSGDENASAHLMVNLNGVEIDVSTLLERTDRTLNLQLDSQYRTPFRPTAEKATIVLKLQNFSNSKVLKFANIGELTMTQYPRYNFVYQHNLMLDNSQQLDHSLKLGWNGEEQIQSDQFVKWASLRGKFDLECKSKFVYRPMMIDYDVTSYAILTGFGVSGPKRYEITMLGRSQNENKDGDFKGEITYHHMSKSPLKMKMHAELKSNSIDFIYNDKIEEVTPNNFNGELSVQLSPEQRYDANYRYQMEKGENRQQQHELEFEFNNPITRFTAKHHGMLRLVPDQLFQLKSKLVANNVDLCDGEIKLTKEGPSHFEMNHYGQNMRTKLMLNPYSLPMAGNLEFENKRWKHDSMVEYSPAELLKFHSNTKRDNQHLLTIESEYAPKQTSRFMLNSKPFKGQLDYNLNEMPNEKLASWEFSMPDSWSHQSKLEIKPRDQKVMLQSLTRYQNYDLANLEAKYHPEDEHYFRLTTPMAQTDLYAQMHQRNNAQRKASLSMVAGKLNHESQLEIEPDNDFKFVSLTRNNGKKLANLKYQLIDNVHNIEFDSDDLLKAKAECNLAHETSKPYANIDFTLDNLEHKTKLMGERDTESLFVDSLTTKPREADRTIAEIKATISKKAGHKSFATVRIGDHIRSNIELEPYKSALVKFDCPHYIHKTELNYHPTENQQTKYWDLRSETTSAQNQKKYNFGISHRTNDKSFVKVAIPTFESELVYDHPENNLNNHQMVFDFEGNTNIVPYSHKSQVRLVRDNYQTNKPVFQVRTKTMHKLTGANMLELDGLYRHQDTELPSTFDLKLGRSVNGNIKLNPFHPTVKTLSLEGQMQDDRTGKFYTHQTKVELHPEALSIQSQTENNGQNVAMLNTFLTTDQDKMSHFELKGDHDDFYTKFELEPRNRRALLSLDVKPYQHKTELMRDIDNNNNNDDNLFTGYRLTSNTMKNRENLYSLDTIWNRMDRPSHLTMKSNGKFETEIRYRPEKRMAEFGLKTNTIQHNSHISLNRNRIARSIEQSPKQLYFKSNTIYRDSVLADIDAKLHGMDGDNVFNCDLPHFTLKSSLNVPERKTNLDFLSKTASRRHILGSVYLNKDNLQIQDNNDRTFHADLAWDVDRNQDSKVMLELQVKQSLSAYSTSYPKLDFDLQMQYGQNKLVLDSEFMSDNVFSHPVRTSLAFVPLDNYRTAEAWELIYTHKTDAQSRFECELNYVEAEQIKYNAILNGQISEQFVKFNGQTKVPHNLNLQVSFNLEAGIRERNNYYLVADASHAISNVYKTKFEIQQNEAEKRFDGKVEFKLPNVETQLVNFYVDLAERKVHLEIVNEVNENKFQLDLNYDINLVHLTAVSNIPYFPLVDLKLKVVPLRELTAHIDLDGERKGELVITYTGSVYDLKYEFFGKLSSIVTPTLEVISTGNYEQSTAKLICKYNAEQVFVGQFKLDKAGLLDGKWLVEGLVSRHGGELARASLKAFSDQTQRKFSFEYEPTEPTLNQLIAPFSIVISGEQQPNQIEVVSIKLTRAQQQLFDLDLVLKYREQPLYYYQSRYYESIVRNIPEKVECVIRHYPTDRRVEFQVSLMEYLELNHNSQHSLLESHAKRPVTSKVRNQLLVNLNGRSVGFVLVTTNFDHQYTVEQNLLIHSPVNGRVLQYQTGYQLHQDYFLYLGQFKTDVRRPDPLYRYRLSLETDSESNYLINAELDSYKFRRSPKLVNVVVRKSTTLRPVDAKVQIDVGQSESDILTVESYVEEKRSNEIAYQHGLNTTAFLAVYTQDRLVDFSVNAHIAESGFGLVLKNVNYRGERSEHFYQARFLDNQRFEIDLINPEHRFRVEGALKTNPRSESNLFVADFVVYQWYHDVEQRTQYRRSPITEQTLNADRVHKVHLEATGKCVRADIENVKFTDEIRQINACFDLDNANIVNVAVDTIRNGEKVADLNVRLDTRSAGNALKLYLHWNPEYARQIVQYLTNKYNDGEQYDSDFISHELLREFQHKYSILIEKLSNELLNEPFVKIILEEIVPILNELGIDLPQIEKFIRLYLIEFVEYARDYYQTVVYRFDQIFVQSWLQPFVRSVTLVGYRAQEVCEQNVFCHSVSNVLSTWTDSESLSNYLVEQLLTTVQHAHRFVATSRNGYWLRDYLPNLTFPQTITRYTKHTLATIWNYVRDSFESTTPLRKLFHHIETCYYEFVNSSALGSVNWLRIREALRQTVELVCSPSTWYSSGRFVLYDPQNGDLQIELRSPLVQKTRAYADKYYYNHLNQSTITPARGSYQPLYSNRYGQGPRVSSMRAGTYGNLYRGLFE